MRHIRQCHAQTNKLDVHSYEAVVTGGEKKQKTAVLALKRVVENHSVHDENNRKNKLLSMKYLLSITNK